MNFVTSAALSLVSAGILYFMKREGDQVKKEAKEVAVKQDLMDIFQDVVFPRCVDLSTLRPLNLTHKNFNSLCKEKIEAQKSKFDVLLGKVRSLIPALDPQKTASSPNGNPEVISFTVPTENGEVSIQAEIQKVKTVSTFKNTIPEAEEKCGGAWEREFYTSRSLRIIASDPMDEQTSTLVRLALNQINKELQVKSDKFIESVSNDMFGDIKVIAPTPFWESILKMGDN